MNQTRSQTRSLDAIATEGGTFAIIAMDQRNTLRRMFTAVGRDGTDAELRTAKADVARALTPLASGLLSDPTYGVPAISEADALADTCGLLVAAEPAQRRSHEGEPRTYRDPALNAQWVLDQGGDAVKFFVQLRADRPAPRAGEPDLVAETLAACQEVVDDGRATGVPVVIENLVYALPGPPLQGRAREDAIIEAVRALNDLDIDLLKLEYPGSPSGCRRLAAVLDRPWAVLSAGVPFDEFSQVMRIAFDEGGASGFIAGRSVWREAVALDGADREQFLWNVARVRLEELTAVAARYARPWQKGTRLMPGTSPVQ
jgi:tagatose 1,6-diphosphate aldolase/sulfofructosephosphate aldolase